MTKISQISTPHSSETAQPMLVKLETYNYCRKTTHCAKRYFDRTTWVVWADSQFATVRFLSLPFLVSWARAQVMLSSLSHYLAPLQRTEYSDVMSRHCQVTCTLMSRIGITCTDLARPKSSIRESPPRQFVLAVCSCKVDL